MTRKLRLYVWEDVLTDWTSGVMFALATSPDHARKLILEKDSATAYDLGKEPKVYETAVGFAVWGGS